MSAIDEVKRDKDMTLPPSGRSSGDPDVGMADSPAIVELDDAFLSLNHQDVQKAASTVGTVGCE